MDIYLNLILFSSTSKRILKVLSRVVLLLLSSTVLSCVHKIVDARVIVGKRYVETDRNMLPELELDLLPDTSSELWKSVNTAFLQKNYKKN